MKPRVREILSWYGAENIGVLTNLARILNHGRLKGTGKMLILPVDQGFEHGPARSFATNPDGYDPYYHMELAIEAGCNAYAAPLGALESCARDYAGEIPLILKLNHSDSLYATKSPISSVTANIDQALRLGCVGVGFTIYPGSSERKTMFEELALVAREAREAGLVLVVWSYPRGEQLTQEGETAIDVVSYAAHIAAQLGAHIIKVKPPSSHIFNETAKKSYVENGIKIGKLSDRTRHIVQSTFNGKRMVIFSGGAAKARAEILNEVSELARGGAFGSIVGRNAFQRPKAEAIALLKEIMETLVGKPI